MRTSRKRPSASPGLFVCYVAAASATSIAQFAAFALNILRAQRTTLELLNRSHYCTIFKLCLQRLAQIAAAAACMHAGLPQPSYVRLHMRMRHRSVRKVLKPLQQAIPADSCCKRSCDLGGCAGVIWQRPLHIARHLLHLRNLPHPAQSANKTAVSASAAGTRSRTPVGSITASSSAQRPILAQYFRPAQYRAGPYVCTGSLRWLWRNLRVSQPQTPPRHPRRCCCHVHISQQVRAGRS